MIRHLIPRIEYGSWSGAALTVDSAGGKELPDGITRSARILFGEPTTTPVQDEVVGGVFCLQWFGLMIEIGVGKVRS